MSNQTYIPISGKLTPQTTDGVILDSFYVKDGFIVVNDSSEFNRLLQVYTDRNLTAKVYNISDNKTYLYQDGSFTEDPELIDLKNYIDDKDSSLYNYIDTESSRAQEAESELSDRIKFIEDDYLDSSDKEELQDEINLKANKSYVDNNFLNKTTDQDQLIQSNVIIAGDLTVEGTEHITDVETIESQSNLVIVNSNNIPLLAVGGAGIIARTGNQDDSAEAYAVSYYDAIKDSVVLGLGHYSDDSSIGKTFSLTEGQSIATRADSSQMVDGNIPEWDAEHYTFVDSGKKVSDFVLKNQTIAGIDLQDNITKSELLSALNVADGAQVNVLDGVKDSNGNDLTITNKKVQLSKSAVGLSNVVNTGDSATPVNGGTTKFTTGGAFIELAKKVDKTTTVAGIALSGNISAQSLTDALVYMNTTTDLDYVMGE